MYETNTSNISAIIHKKESNVKSAKNICKDKMNSYVFWEWEEICQNLSPYVYARLTFLAEGTYYYIHFF